MNTTTAAITLATIAATVAEYKQAVSANSSTQAEIAKLEQAKNLFADMPEMLAGIDAKIQGIKASAEYTDTTTMEQNIVAMVKELSDSELLSLATKGIRISSGNSGSGTKRAKLVTLLDGTQQTFANKAEIVRQYIDANFDQNADGTKRSISASLFLTPEKLANAGIAKIEDIESGESDSE